MQSENSVVTALAELGRMEQERVDGERRRAAELRVRALERSLADRANERVERELAAATAQLTAAHDAREAELTARVQRLERELMGARATAEVLRASMTAREPAAPPQRNLAGPLLGLIACGLAGWALLQNARTAAPPPARELPASTSEQHPAALAPTPGVPETALTPVTASTAAAPKAQTAQTTRAPAHTVRKRQESRGQQPIKPQTDPLGTLDTCDENDPTCGL